MQRGNIIWASWQPAGAGVKPPRVHSISSGTMLVMLTPQGARNLKHAVTNIAVPAVHEMARRTGEDVLARGHFDAALNNLLQESGRAVDFGACYIVPPVGNYSTHQSGCNPTLSTGAGRPGCWGERWCCPGTRKEDDPQRRDKWLASFTKKAQPEWLTKVNVSEDPRRDWTSFWGGAAEGRVVSMAEHRARKGKGEKGTGKYAGEPAAPAAGADKGKTKGGGHHEKGGKQWRPKKGAGSRGGTEEDDDPEGKGAQRATKRQRRDRRGHLVNRSFRCWVETELEVGIGTRMSCHTFSMAITR